MEIKCFNDDKIIVATDYKEVYTMRNLGHLIFPKEKDCWRLANYDYGNLPGKEPYTFNIHAIFHNDGTFHSLECTYNPTHLATRIVSFSKEGNIVSDSITLVNPFNRLKKDTYISEGTQPYTGDTTITSDINPEEYFNQEHVFRHEFSRNVFKNILFDDHEIKRFLTVADIFKKEFNSFENKKDLKRYIKEKKR